MSKKGITTFFAVEAVASMIGTAIGLAFALKTNEVDASDIPNCKNVFSKVSNIWNDPSKKKWFKK